MAVTVYGNSVEMTNTGDFFPKVSGTVGFTGLDVDGNISPIFPRSPMRLKGIRLVSSADTIPTAGVETDLRQDSLNGPGILNVELSAAHTTAFIEMERDFDSVYVASRQPGVIIYLDLA